ncbi:MAG: hypothetical protein D4R96_03375 [Nitrosopumilaceae archaeon]|nr:MAG: hypothetical protein D4R96_03375 [Nitrosopumilaceae archaeon]
MARLLIGTKDGQTLEFDNIRYGDLDRKNISYFSLVGDDLAVPLFIHTFGTDEIPIYRIRTGNELVHIIGYQIRGTKNQYLAFIHEDGRIEIHDEVGGVNSCLCTDAIHHTVPLMEFEN